MDNKLLIAKLQDKIRLCKTQNKITNSDFLNEQQVAVIKNALNTLKEKDYFFFGDAEELQRKVLIIFPEKIDKKIVIKNVNSIIGSIKVEIPNELKGKIKHKDYLGTIMSFGLTRERIGDIIVYEDRAYIIAFKENLEYIKDELKNEKRFKKANVEIINVNNIEIKPLQFEQINISVSSLRLDNIIAELLNTSRKVAQERIEEESVLINYLVETKNTKNIKEKDTIVIRKSGKYIIEKFLGKNKNGKELISIKKYK